jgi:hypothetical protein
VADTTFDKLLAEISEEDFVRYQLPGRIRCDELNDFIERYKPDIRTAEGRDALRRYIEPTIPDAQHFVDELADFTHIDANLPSSDKNYLPSDSIDISPEQSREQIIDALQQARQSNVTADLAFYAYRDIESCRWEPFVKAAVERNPVSIKAAEDMPADEAFGWLENMKEASIYDGKRLAQPDEVANYKTGDGLERAFTLANIIRDRDPEHEIEVIADKNQAVVKGQNEYRFESAKNLEKHINICADGKIIVSD